VQFIRHALGRNDDHDMTTQYYSEKERGPVPRTIEGISAEAWGGVVAAVTSAVQDGSFGEDFPAVCQDGGCPCGTDEHAFSLALRAEITGISWPLQTEVRDPTDWRGQSIPCAPESLDVLDFVQFCYLHISKATQKGFHSYFKHYHLSFDRNAGRIAFRERINRIFARNGIAFELLADGNIRRLLPPVLAEAIHSPLRPTGDAVLDSLLEDARRKILSPDLKMRSEALERLWDAWERLKTVKVPTDKKESIGRLLEAAADEPTFRARLDQEAKELTAIGNGFMIRHTEVEKVRITDGKHIDYLFHRLFALIHLLVTAGLDKP
jgi:hypothetical protein